MFLKIMVDNHSEPADPACKRALLKVLTHPKSSDSLAIISGQLNNDDTHELLDELLAYGPVAVQIQVIDQKV